VGMVIVWMERNDVISETTALKVDKPCAPVGRQERNIKVNRKIKAKKEKSKSKRALREQVAVGYVSLPKVAQSADEELASATEFGDAKVCNSVGEFRHRNFLWKNLKK